MLCLTFFGGDELSCTALEFLPRGCLLHVIAAGPLTERQPRTVDFRTHE